MKSRTYAKHTSRRAHQPGKMNKAETAYAHRLELLKKAGDIIGYEFECYKFKLAANTFFTPDFVVYSADGTMEVHEVKGHWEDDARVKIKVFADRYPIRVRAVMKAGGGWNIEEIKPS